MPFRIPTPEIDAVLEASDGWQRKGKTLIAGFTFDLFETTLDFQTQVAQQAETRQQCADVSNNGNRVEIALTTPALGGITDADLEFAAIISRIAEAAGNNTQENTQ